MIDFALWQIVEANPLLSLCHAGKYQQIPPEFSIHPCTVGSQAKRARLCNVNNNGVIHPETICSAEEWPSFLYSIEKYIVTFLCLNITEIVV